MRWGSFQSPNGSVAAFQAADLRYRQHLEMARTFWDLDADFNAIRALGADRTVVVSFDLHHWRFHLTPAIWLREIAAGQHDDILTSIGTGLASLNAEVYATLKHEPDLDVDDGQFTIEDWNRASRRFAQVVRPLAPLARLGPIFSGKPRTDYSAWKPGQIRFVGVDPYSYPPYWEWPADMLARRLPPLIARWPRKDIVVCETAAPEDPRKPDWIGRLPEALAAYPKVIAALWFDVNKEHDWRWDSSPESLEAARLMLEGT